jgi:hypothetical protein
MQQGTGLGAELILILVDHFMNARIDDHLGAGQAGA